MPSTQAVGTFLEMKAAQGSPIRYTDVVNAFNDLPPLTGNWKAHPLCGIFGELDAEDYIGKKAFRTALVVTMENNRPGHGFFDMLDSYRGTTTSPNKRDDVWLPEFTRLISEYA